jgi:hypothetical protein
VFEVVVMVLVGWLRGVAVDAAGFFGGLVDKEGVGVPL